MDGRYSKGLQENEGFLHCPNCSRNAENHTSFTVPHQQPRYWLITAFLHLTAFLIVFVSVYSLYHPHSDSKPQLALKNAPAQPKPVNHDDHLIGTPLGLFSSPFYNHV